MSSVKLLGNLPRGLFFVISAPAGTGKTTLSNMLQSEFDCVVRSVSYTTRPKRANEVNGIDYHFVDEKTFQQMIGNDEFLEYAKVFNYYYGTSKEYVENMLSVGKHVLLVIDTQGAMQVRDNKIPATLIFIKPPNFEELKNRLKKRNTESTQVLALRLSKAEEEMNTAVFYDYEITNDDLKIAYEKLRSILITEECEIKQ